VYAAVAERQARGRAGRCAPGIGCRVSSGASAGWQGTQGVRRGRRCWQPAPAAANAPATACCSGRRQACLRGGRTAEQRSGWQLRCVAALGRMHRTSCAKLTLMMALRAGDAGPVLPPSARRLHHAGGRALVARRRRRRQRLRRQRRRRPGAGGRGRAAPGRVRALRRLQPCRGTPPCSGRAGRSCGRQSCCYGRLRRPTPCGAGASVRCLCCGAQQACSLKPMPPPCNAGQPLSDTASRLGSLAQT